MDDQARARQRPLGLGQLRQVDVASDHAARTQEAGGARALAGDQRHAADRQCVASIRLVIGDGYRRQAGEDGGSTQAGLATT